MIMQTIPMISITHRLADAGVAGAQVELARAEDALCMTVFSLACR
jgi:hypothetical protein